MAIAKLAVWLAPVLVTELGVNVVSATETPAGRPPVMLNGEVQEVLLPLKLTVIV